MDAKGQNSPEPRAGRGTEGFALTKGDLAILSAVYEYRFVHREHLSLLTGRHPKRLHRRLLKLVQNRYLTTTRLPQQKHIYSIGRAGLPVLVAHGMISGDLSRERLRVNERKELFLKHEMLIVDHHILFTLAGKKSGLQETRANHYRHTYYKDVRP